LLQVWGVETRLDLSTQFPFWNGEIAGGGVQTKPGELGPGRGPDFWSENRYERHFLYLPKSSLAAVVIV
jgi:hypothetical protein